MASFYHSTTVTPMFIKYHRQTSLLKAVFGKKDDLLRSQQILHQKFWQGSKKWDFYEIRISQNKVNSHWEGK